MGANSGSSVRRWRTRDLDKPVDEHALRHALRVRHDVSQAAHVPNVVPRSAVVEVKRVVVRAGAGAPIAEVGRLVNCGREHSA